MSATDHYRGYDGAGVLLYTGISQDVFRRTDRHEREKEWAAHGVRWRIDEYETRQEAHAAEIAAIHDEEPVFNRRRYGAIRPPWAATYKPVPFSYPKTNYKPKARRHPRRRRPDAE